ncbi:MAG TPA: hypothetical protein VE913_03930 [Longimicrobium sp.]|nr:hypothetical protein [Longimicrobium sp.]
MAGAALSLLLEGLPEALTGPARREVVAALRGVYEQAGAPKPAWMDETADE